MSKLRQNAALYQTKDFIREVDVRCAYLGLRNNEAVGKALGITGRTVANHRKDPGKMDVCILKKMVKILSLDPGEVLLFLGYSAKDINKFAKNYIQQSQ